MENNDIAKQIASHKFGIDSKSIFSDCILVSRVEPAGNRYVAEEISSILNNALDGFGYDRFEKNGFNLVLGELYDNAIIHGSQAGDPEQYTQMRGRDAPQHWQENKKKLIYTDILVNEKAWIIAIQDCGTGMGYKNPKYSLEHLVDEKIGMGSSIINKYTDYVFNMKKKSGFVVIAYKFRDQELG